MDGPKAWLLLFSASLLVALLLAELTLRALGFSYYWSVARRPDPHRGWAPAASAEGWQRFEGKAYVRINGVRVRDRSHALAKPPGTLRIAVLGDSFAEAVQVPIGQTFWRVMEGALRACNSKASTGEDASATAPSEVEVLNFGVSGYSTAQSLLTLRHQAVQYQPDIVLLAFFQGNDLTENSPALDDDDLRPYFVYENDRLVLDDSYLRSPAYALRDAWYGRLAFSLLGYSRSLQALDRSKDLISIWLNPGEAKHADDSAPAPAEHRATEPGVDTRLYSKPQDPDWADAWRVTEGIIQQLHQEVRAAGARFVLVTLSTGAQVHPDPGFREQFQQRTGATNLFYPEERLRALSERAGFDVINLAPELALYAMLNRVWLHGFENSRPGVGHWNALGHNLAGQAIAERLCRGLCADPCVGN